MTNYDDIKNEILKSIDIVDVARDYNIDIPDANRNNIMTSCPLHPHQGTRCFSINAHKGLFSCFSSHHSGEINSGDCINLVRMIEGCGYVDALQKLADRYRPDLLAAFSGNGNSNKATSTNPALSKAIRELWHGRGVKFLPESVIVKSSEVQYLTYTHAQSNGKPDTALFQHVYQSNLTKRLAPKGELQHELYVPRPWDMYKGCQELYLVEGIPDTFTYLNFGKKAVGAFNNGSVDRELFQQELTTFLDYIEPQKVVIVPDPDAYAHWHDALTTLLDGYALDWIDLSLWHVEPSKFDSNALLQECAGHRRDFFRALSWCRKNSNPCQKPIGKKVIEKRPDGYFEIPEEGDPKRLTNFTLYYRSFARDAESQEGRVEVTIQYGGTRRRRVTRVVETKVLGDGKKFQEVLASVKHTLFVNELRAIHFFEDSNYQYFDEVQSFDKFGQLSNDLVLFKNVAVYKGKAFYSNKNGVIALPDRAVCTLADDAPSLTLTSDNGVNQKLVSTLYAAYGLNGVLSLAFDLASIRMKSIVDRYGNHPLKYLHGEPGIGKTKLETEIKKLFGISRALTARDTRASLERVAQSFQYLPLPIHEWKPEHEEATDFLEKAYDRHIKNRAETDNSHKVKNNELAAFLTVSSNYVPTPKTALHTRNAYLSFQKTAFDKTHLNALESLVARSDIVLRTYLANMDIDAVHTEARTAIELLNEDARTVNNYAPFLVGLAILKDVGAVSDAMYKDYRKEFLETMLPDTLTNITEDTLVEDFLQELHNKAIHVTRTNQFKQGFPAVDVEYETEINPGTHYIVREKAETRYLILDLSSCVAVVNKGNRAQFDKKVLQQALRDSPYFAEQRNTTKWTGGNSKYKAVWLSLDTIEEKLGITLRKSMSERPENLMFREEENI